MKESFVKTDFELVPEPQMRELTHEDLTAKRRS